MFYSLIVSFFIDMCIKLHTYFFCCRCTETHRTVLNQILRQSTVHLADGPFSVLVDHTRLLDFDIKRKYFRTELERADDGMRREDLAVHVRREHVFEDSFRELHRRSPDEWKNRFYIVFEGKELNNFLLKFSSLNEVKECNQQINKSLANTYKL